MTEEKNTEPISCVSEEPDENNAYEASKDDSFTFSIVRHFGTMSTASTGWSREFNLVSWNNRRAKYDIRDWSPDHTKMTRGITLTAYEAKRLQEFLTDKDLEKIPEEAV